MDVTASTKHPEVGMIPNDWNVQKFEELCDVITCGVAATPTYVSSVEGMPFLSASNVQNGQVKTSDLKYIPYQLYNQLVKNTKPRRGDILYTRVGAGIGEAAVIEIDLDFAIYVSLTLIRPKKNLLNAHFLQGLLNSNRYRFLAKRDLFSGAGVQNLNVQVVRDFPIPVPPIKEQSAIATALSDTDALIASLEKLIAKKRLIKQGVMQKLLEPKKGWDSTTLGDVAFVIGGGTPSTTNSRFWNGGINWFTPTEIGHSKYVYSSQRKLTDEGLRNSSARLLPTGTVLLTSRAGIGDVSILKSESCTNQGFQSLVAKPNVDNEYLYYLVLTLKSILLQNSSGSTFLEISPSKVKSIQISMPDYKEQVRVSRILSDVDLEIDRLEDKLNKARIIKQGMMQTLLTGKIRLI